MTVQLTANEAAILKAYPNFQYAADYTLDDLVADPAVVWTWSFVDDAAAAAGITRRGASGVIASLKRKGLVTCQNTGPYEYRTITPTAAGMEQVVALQDPKPAHAEPVADAGDMEMAEELHHTAEPEVEPAASSLKIKFLAIGMQCWGGRGYQGGGHYRVEEAQSSPGDQAVRLHLRQRPPRGGSVGGQRRELQLEGRPRDQVVHNRPLRTHSRPGANSAPGLPF